ncbi:MAG: ATP synthase subunit I [Candidatus Bathyanammoxibius sp.]
MTLTTEERQPGALFELDHDFPQRVFDTSLFVGILLVCISTALNSINITMSLVAGVAISLASCHTLWWSIRRFIRPDVTGRKPAFLLIGVLKYVALGVGLFFLFRHIDVHIIAFFVGLSILQAVIVLKFMSLLLVDLLNKSIKAPGGTTQDVS